jgi:hypothetical protein
MQALEKKVDTCLMLLRSLVAANNEMRGVRQWELNKQNQRERQANRRADKNDEIASTPRVENPLAHCLYNDFKERDFLYAEPTCADTMMEFLKSNVKGDAVTWFTYKVRESAGDALKFLFCLYNNCFEHKWIKNSGPPYTVLRGWEVGIDPRQPDWRTNVPKSSVYPSKVPKGEWTDLSRIQYSKCLCWKVFATVYFFLDDFILEHKAFGDSEDEQINNFLAIASVMSAHSGLEVFPGRDWAPTKISSTKDWSEEDAKRACHLVAPRVAILVECLRKGANKNITDYFQ